MADDLTGAAPDTDAPPPAADPTDPAGPAPSAASRPALEARDLVVDSPHGPGAPISLAARAGTLTVLFRADRGSAELALALAGRYRARSGQVLLDGAEAGESALRRRVVLARVLDAVQPEPSLTVAELMSSAIALNRAVGPARDPGECLTAVGLPDERHGARIEALDPADDVRACVAAAVQVTPAAVLVDRADRGLLDGEWAALVADLAVAARATGVAIVVTSSRPTPGADVEPSGSSAGGGR